jgi:hypothetical protein
MVRVNLHIACLSIISITIILAASIVSVIALTEFGNFRVAQGQGNNITSSLTPQQKAAICDPNNPKLKFINSTESRICGIPPTPTNATTSANITSSDNNTSSSLAPSAIPST